MPSAYKRDLLYLRAAATQEVPRNSAKLHGSGCPEAYLHCCQMCIYMSMFVMIALAVSSS